MKPPTPPTTITLSPLVVKGNRGIRIIYVTVFLVISYIAVFQRGFDQSRLLDVLRIFHVVGSIGKNCLF